MSEKSHEKVPGWITDCNIISMLAHQEKKNHDMIWFSLQGGILLHLASMFQRFCVNRTGPLSVQNFLTLTGRNFICWIGNASMLSFSLSPLFLRGRGWHCGHHSSNWHCLWLHLLNKQCIHPCQTSLLSFLLIPLWGFEPATIIRIVCTGCLFCLYPW